MAKDDLPTGIQSFGKVREGGLRYVDKTAYARQLADEGGHFFLSRPRRFGKSLFVSMLKGLFEGKEELFRGLAIHPDWDWSVERPVVRLDFGEEDFSSRALLHEYVVSRLEAIERDFNLESGNRSGPPRLGDLIETLHRSRGRRVVLLVDEYDRPVTDNLGVWEVAEANRKLLRGLYGVTKTRDEHLEFSFFTGVTRFSRSGLFSGSNNLTDITMRPECSAICGYTEADLDRVFGDRLVELDRKEVQDWYNGYWWLGEERVYNPYCILRLLKERKFRTWWYETGTQEFLINELVRRDIGGVDLDGRIVSDTALSVFDVRRMSIEALLFQTGYLTIKDELLRGGRLSYSLTYPNREVRQTLNEALLEELVPAFVGAGLMDDLRDALLNADAKGLETALRSVIARVPYHWFPRKSEGGGGDEKGRAPGEAHYSTIVHAACLGAGFDARGEVATSQGRIDLLVRTSVATYLFEFKVADPNNPGAALRQIHERDYPAGVGNDGLPVLLVGVEIDSGRRNIVRFDTEPEGFVGFGRSVGSDHRGPGDPGADDLESKGRGSKGPSLSM